MAQGEVFFFDQFLYDLTDADIGHDFGAGNTTVVKCAVITSNVTPTVATPDPRWGAGGGTNFLTDQVNVTPAYVTGGNSCLNPATSLNGGVVEFAWDDPTPFSPDPGGSLNATWGILYNDSLAGKQCIGYIDLGGEFDMTGGTLTVDLPAPVATLNQA